MTIKTRISLSIAVQAVMILMVCFFSYLAFRNILARLQTIERVDDLNINLLEIRRAEKNYFLYKDAQALHEAITRGEKLFGTLNSSGNYNNDATRPMHNNLRNDLALYLQEARVLLQEQSPPASAEAHFRDLGHRLTSLSENLLKAERKDINRIIHSSILRLTGSLAFILLLQFIFGHYFFRVVARELNRLKWLMQRISAGKINEPLFPEEPRNEIQMAGKALVNMAQELEKREQELFQAKKLASMGVLIAGVAHELGNPLNNISMLGQTYLSIYDILGDEEKKAYMEDVLNQTERIQRIILKLLDFSRQKRPELRDYHPLEIVNRGVELVANQLKISNIKLHIDADEPLPLIRVDAPQIEQVLINLMINAIQAMPQGGEIYLSISSPPPMDQVIISIRDTGIGIPREILANIFDPFFSTKGTKGTGLGLSVSYGIIKEHGGEITVASEGEGKGTTFTIKLPAWPEEGA